MTTIAKLIFTYLEKKSHSDDGLTIKQARDTANILPLIHHIDLTDMAQEEMQSHRYTFKDDSELIIDDEGFIYCDEDCEIGILAN